MYRTNILLKSWRFWLVMILIGGVASACAGDTPETEVIDPAVVGSETYRLGESVYASQCAACHGANGEGQFPEAPMQPDATGRIGAPPHDGTGHTWHHDDTLLVRYIREGGMGDPARFYPMPAFEDALTDEEIIAVIAYIKTMWTPDQQAAQRANTLAVQGQQ